MSDAVKTLRVIRLSDRVAPDGTWCAGDVHELPVREARQLLEVGLVQLAPGAILPAAEPERAPAHAPPREGGEA